METIQEVLTRYFQSWNEGFKTHNAEKIKELMSRQFSGYWAHSGIAAPEIYTYDYDIKGVLEQTSDAEKSFEIALITPRKNGEEYLISGRETNMIQGQPYTAQCIFVWRLEHTSWKLLREYIELER